MARTKVVSSAVPEDIEKWIKYRAKKEGVSPSLWISNLLSYSMMIDPSARFSPSAVGELLSKDFQAQNATPVLMAAQLIDEQTVPEPATLALWGLVAAGLLVGRRVRAGMAVARG